MTPEAIRSSGELTPEALGKAGKILIDAFFLRVKTFDDFKTKTADAFPEDKRKLAFKEGRVDFYLESRFSPIQRLRVTMTDPKREDRKIGEVRPEK